MSKDRFEATDSSGFYEVKQAAEPTPHEKPDTQGTITEHSEENS